MASRPDIDHRTRTAALRRERMYRRLIESAVAVFARHGVDASVIERVIAEAGVSRGTFYNYFPSNRALLLAANHQLGQELLELVENSVAMQPDPARRVAQGIRLFIEASQRYPLVGRFIAQVGIDAIGPGALLYRKLPPLVAEATDRGSFVEMPKPVACDLVAGTVLLYISRSVDDPVATGDPRHAVAAILRGLGVAPQDVAALLDDGPKVLAPPRDSLLARSHAQMLDAASKTDA